jgi:alginate O-acetyltransferase complex protein AlgI
VYAFAFQIYCDFSGYTDAARGVAKCLGFELALNFNLPYFATGPKDFWARWHISLSTWLRDYLYIPLGGNRGGRLKQYRNLLLTMALGGLWHGAAWTFVLWGVFHGLWLIAHRLLQPLLDRLKPADPVHEACWTAVRVVTTFHLVCFGWLLFRASSLAQVGGMLAAIGSHLALPVAATLAPVVLLILPLLAYEYAQHRAGNPLILARTPWYVRGLFYAGCYYAIAWAGEYGGPQFIDFQF